MVFLVCLVATSVALAAEVVDRTNPSHAFDGIGAISGGGATSRLLPDYAEPARSQILDYLFKPNFGASLQMLKVEIGGDSQSTDGTESSHMHTADHVDLHTGYEWWLMKQAKERNPDIKLYGLAWAFPGWVSNQSGNPFEFPDLTSKYLVEWVKGAKQEYGLDIDFMGIWNERASDSTFVQTLRQALNSAGFKHTKIIAQDGGLGICNALARDSAYADAVDIIGVHYPYDWNDFSVCHSLGKPIWASEESSSYDDLNGAACWGRVINAHWVLNQMTSSIMWNLVGSYYHGTNWYASSMMTAVQPWSGHYEVNPVIWATAHVTQFTEIGWRYLGNGTGSGELPLGGYYVTWVDPNSEDFTMNIVKISEDHAACTRPGLPKFNTSAETVTFQMHSSMKVPAELQVWRSNFENYSDSPSIFEHSTIAASNGGFSLEVRIGDMYTVTTLKNRGNKGNFGKIPPSSPSFPLPYSDDFQNTPESQDAKWFADQIGAFEVHHSSSDDEQSLVQMVPKLPIGWSDHGSNGPMTLIGMREWQDIFTQVDFKLPKSSQSNASDAACIATRVDQMWQNGVVLCVNGKGQWNLTNSGPPLQGEQKAPPANVAQGTLSSPLDVSSWHTIALRSEGILATAWIDNQAIFKDQTVRDIDVGFAAIGSNGWFPTEYRNFSVRQTVNGWKPQTPCPAIAGGVLTAQPCARNGVIADDQSWNLLPSFQLQHTSSGLCANAAQKGPVMLDVCNKTNISDQQLFVNDYSRIRNMVKPVTVKSVDARLVGSKNGEVSVGSSGDWNAWSYFPNTRQLRNQYNTDTNLGYPMCLSTCTTIAASMVLI